MMGLLLVARTSEKVWSEAWEMSTSMPRRFISATTSWPKGVRPGSLVESVSPEEGGPVVGVRPGEGHGADAEAVVSAEEWEGVLDGVAAFDGEKGGEPSCGLGGEDIVGGEAELHLVGVAAELLVDGVR